MSDGARLSVRLTPRAGADAVALLEDGSLAVRVRAPAVDGAANTALTKVVAKALRVAPSRVTLIRGQRSRIKVLQVDGLDQADIRDRLAAG